MDKSVEALSRYTTGLRFDELPAEVVHAGKRAVIDMLGCVCSGFDSEPGRIARAIARRAVGHPPARILGTQEMSTPELAAFANGVMARFQDETDGYSGQTNQSTCHPSDTLAAVLATADALHASGKTVITAVVAAYETSLNFADVLPREQGLDNTFYALVGAAVGSGMVRGLTAEQMAHAIGLAIVPNFTLEQTRAGELSMWKGCAGANSARNGTFAAALAQEGMTAPEGAIEGKWGLWHALGRRFDWAPFGGEDRPFRILRTKIKTFPAFGHAQSPITVALQLHGQVDLDDIETITIDTYWIAERFLDRASPLWQPTNRETADHSIPYTVAATLIDGKFSVASYDDAHMRDPRLQALMAKTAVRKNAEFEAVYSAEIPCRIEIAMKSGARKVAQVQYYKGHYKNPLSDAELEAKFRHLSGELLTPHQMDAFLARLWRLEEIPDVGGVLGSFRIDTRNA